MKDCKKCKGSDYSPGACVKCKDDYINQLITENQELYLENVVLDGRNDALECERPSLISRIEQLEQQLEEQKPMVELGEALKLISKVQNEEIDYFEYVDKLGNTNCVEFEELIKWAEQLEESEEV